MSLTDGFNLPGVILITAHGGGAPSVLMSRQVMAMSKGRRKDWEAGRLTGDDGGLFAVTVETTSFQLRLVFRLD